MSIDLKKILIRISFFLLLFLGVFFLLNYEYINFVLSKKNLYRQEQIYKDYFKINQNKELDFGFFGDSHVAYGINPEFIQNSYNFATEGEDSFTTFYKLKRVLNNNIKIKNFVIPIDLHSFLDSQFSSIEDRIVRDMYIYQNIIPYNQLNKITNRSFVGLFVCKIFPVIGNGYEFFDLLRAPILKEFYLGHIKTTNDYSKNKEKEITAKRIYQQFFKNKSRLNPFLVGYFKKILLLLKENNINIIFVKMPVSSEYFKYNFDKNYYREIFEEIDNTIGKNYNVLDFQTSFFDHPEYFADSHHLNSTGAIVLSTMFNQKMLINK